MSYAVKTTGTFEKQARRLIKKYPSLTEDLLKLIESLKIDPKQGKPLGADSYKIRLSIRSKGKGKSGGSRVITHVVFVDSIVYLLAIYDKSEQESLTDKELSQLLKEIN